MTHDLNVKPRSGDADSDHLATTTGARTDNASYDKRRMTHDLNEGVERRSGKAEGPYWDLVIFKG